MSPVNTTSGTVPDPQRHPMHVVNTSDSVYEDEESETLAVLPASGYHATIKAEDGTHTVPLVCWVAEDSGKLYGVAVGDDGLVDLNNSVEDYAGFQRYSTTNQQTKGKK